MLRERLWVRVGLRLGSYWVYPSAPAILGYRYNNITYNECNDLYDDLNEVWGLWWISASACSQYDADNAVEEYYFFWEGSLEAHIGYPLDYWYASGGPFACCGYYVHVCN